MERKIKAARALQGMTQREVAAALGLSMQAYYQKECGKSRFYADELRELAKLFNVHITYFFE